MKINPQLLEEILTVKLEHQGKNASRRIDTNPHNYEVITLEEDIHIHLLTNSTDVLEL